MLLSPIPIKKISPLYGNQSYGVFFHELKEFIKAHKLHTFHADDEEVNICNYWKIKKSPRHKSGLIFYKYSLKTQNFEKIKKPKILLEMIPYIVVSKGINIFNRIKSACLSSLIKDYIKLKRNEMDPSWPNQDKLAYIAILFFLKSSSTQGKEENSTQKRDILEVYKYYGRVLHSWICTHSKFQLKERVSYAFKLGYFKPGERFSISFWTIWSLDLTKTICLYKQIKSDQYNLAPLALFIDQDNYHQNFFSYENIEKGIGLKIHNDKTLNFKLSKSQFKLIKTLPEFVISEWIRLVTAHSYILPLDINRNEDQFKKVNFSIEILIIVAEAIKKYKLKPYAKQICKFVYALFYVFKRGNDANLLHNDLMRSNLINIFKSTSEYIDSTYGAFSPNTKYRESAKYLTSYPTSILAPILDYLIAHQEFKVANNSSLNTINRRVEYWHQVLTILRSANDIEVMKSDTWNTSLLCEPIQNNELCITEINSAYALYTEGRDVQHCIYTYLYRCRHTKAFGENGPEYIAFSVRSLHSDDKSTIGLVWNYNNLSYIFDQHQGLENLSVPPEHKNAVSFLISNISKQIKPN